MRRSNQTALFDGLAEHKPAPAFQAHETVFIVDGEEVARGPLSDDDIDALPPAPTVRVRLRLTGEHVDATLQEGPLSYGECREWEEPCGLHSCRYRLEDAVERRTRRVVEVEDAYGRPVDTLEGPRLRNGAYYSDSKPNTHGDWCALRVAECVPADGTIDGLSAADLGHMFGVSAGVAEQMVQSAVSALGRLDDGDGVLSEHYGDRGRMHGYKFVPEPELTARQAAAAVVPGEIKGSLRRRRVAVRMVPEHVTGAVAANDSRKDAA